MALEFPAPLTALGAAVQQAVTGYAAEADLLAAFRDATLMLFAQEGQYGLYTVTEDDGTRYVPAFTHPDHAPTPGTSGTTPPAGSSRRRGCPSASIRGIASV